MIDTILAYIIIFLPSIASVIGGLLVDYFRKKGIDRAVKAVQFAQDQFNEFTNSNDVKTLIEQNANLLRELEKAKKAETLAYEEITRIHKLHPEWLEDGGANGKE